jgi:cell division protein FtsA
MGGSDLVLAVDIGTTKACALLAKVRDPQEPEILGVGLTPCSGLNKGAVVDLEATSTAISEAVEKCLAMAGTRHRSAVIGIAGSFIRSYNARGTVVVASRGRGVTQHDMDAAVRDAIQKSVPAEMETIHAVPREYRVDDIGGIQDPLSMHGSMLEVDVHLVAASRAGLRNVRRAAQHAGLRIECVALEPLASSLSVLDGAEKSAGVVMIDIGGGTTDVAIFVDGTVRHSEVIPVGGDYITKDISTYFVTPFDQAEDLKIRYGGASTNGIAPDEQIEVKRTKKSRPILVPRRELNFVIEACVE